MGSERQIETNRRILAARFDRIEWFWYQPMIETFVGPYASRSDAQSQRPPMGIPARLIARNKDTGETHHYNMRPLSEWEHSILTQQHPPKGA
jgi:hypothetical protein